MTIHHEPAHHYVSRGGVKLAAALDGFVLSPKDLVCLDIGASTGGFTQVLLQRGARRVYAVDVGHDQLHPMLRANTRVVSIEGRNARELTRDDVPAEIVAIVADVSFISLKLVLAPALALATSKAWAVLLIKPQFEVGRLGIRRGDLVKDNEAREKALTDIGDWLSASHDWQMIGSMQSPIVGGDGNQEYLVAARKS